MVRHLTEKDHKNIDKVTVFPKEQGRKEEDSAIISEISTILKRGCCSLKVIKNRNIKLLHIDKNSFKNSIYFVSSS